MSIQANPVFKPAKTSTPGSTSTPGKPETDDQPTSGEEPDNARHRRKRSNEDIRQEQGARLRKAREQKFNSASDAARELKIPVPTYSAHESGLRGIKSAMADYYSRMLGITPAWLMSGTGSIEDNNSSDGLIQKSTILSNPLMAGLYDLETRLNVTWDGHHKQYVRISDKIEEVELPGFRDSTNCLPLIQFSDDVSGFAYQPAIVTLQPEQGELSGKFYVAGIANCRCVHTSETKYLFAFQHDQVSLFFGDRHGAEFGVFEKGTAALQIGRRMVALIVTKDDLIIAFVEKSYGSSINFFAPDGIQIPQDESKAFSILAVASSTLAEKVKIQTASGYGAAAIAAQ